MSDLSPAYDGRALNYDVRKLAGQTEAGMQRRTVDTPARIAPLQKQLW